MELLLRTLTASVGLLLILLAVLVLVLAFVRVMRFYRANNAAFPICKIASPPEVSNESSSPLIFMLLTEVKQ